MTVTDHVKWYNMTPILNSSLWTVSKLGQIMKANYTISWQGKKWYAFYDLQVFSVSLFVISIVLTSVFVNALQQ